MSGRALFPIARLNPDQLALQLTRHMRGDDFTREFIRREIRLRLGIYADKAPVAGFAQERPVKIDRMGTESGPQAVVRGSPGRRPGEAKSGCAAYFL